MLFGVHIQDSIYSGNTSCVLCDERVLRLSRDETQFSSTAHEILGKDAAMLVNSNATANAQVRMHAPTTDGNGNEVLRIHLRPSLAPGN